ncbi:anti-sigma factor [Catalinimonas niigatensis]|uniref:anti-sigma factor n=1 Tax=Catalinimonas niigatensis TaxID=1397264 RepID=UPI00266674E1|nr:anti-sigma factor [Catalinimonas niigatensis]WPP51582.1 anti-sigma factor [Catalinimonas niigatensis]
MKVEEYIASGILEQYVLGELSAAEEEEVLRYAQNHSEVRSEITAIEESFEYMARSFSVKPPAHVLDKIQHKLSEKDEVEEVQTKKNKKINFLRYGVAATFTLKLMFMAVAAHFWVNWQHSESRLEQMQERYDRLEQETRQLSQAFAVVNDPAYQTIALESKQPNAKARPMLYWNNTLGQLYINPNQLPANEEGTQYQLWAMVKDLPVSLGVFDVSSDSFPQMIAMDGVENSTSFIITLEAEGGSEQPDAEDLRYQGDALMR